MIESSPSPYAMRTTIIVLIAAMMVGALLYRQSSAPSAPRSLGPQNVDGERSRELQAPGVPATGVGREVAGIGEAAHLEGARAVPLDSAVAGTVVDESGSGIPGVDVYFDGNKTGIASRVATSDDQGAFDFACDRSGELYAESHSYAPVARTRVQANATNVIVLVAPAARMAGLVSDEAGSAIDNARVVVQTTEASRRRWGELSPNLAPYVWETETDGSGQFTLEGVAQSHGRYITVSHAGYETELVRLQVRFPQDLEITLRRLEAGRLVGRVVDTDMSPLQDATVSCDQVEAGWQTVAASTNEAGWFSIDLKATKDESTRVTALLKGFLPAEQEVSAAAVTAGLEMLFVLESGELAIAGTVVDDRGQPVPGATVWSFDRTSIGTDETADGMMVLRGLVTAEDVLGSRAGAVTDSQGRFKLSGLVDRQYDRHAISRDLRVGTLTGVQAGTLKTTIPVSGEGERRQLKGRVVTIKGEVVSGATVELSRDFLGDAGDLVGRRELDMQAVTDEEGIFDFGLVHCGGLSLRITASGYGPILGFPLPKGRPDIEVEVFAVRRLQVYATSLNSAQFVALLDRSGQRLVFHRDFGETKISMAVERLVAGRTAVLETTEKAAKIELIAADGTTTEHAFEFTDDPVTMVRL